MEKKKTKLTIYGNPKKYSLLGDFYGKEKF